MRSGEISTEGTYEKEFLGFLQILKENNAENHRLRKSLLTCKSQARSLIEIEINARRAVEMDRDNLEEKFSRVREILREDESITEETRAKFSFLHPKRNSEPNHSSVCNSLPLASSKKDTRKSEPNRKWNYPTTDEIVATS